jgi:hypothetical protein
MSSSPATVVITSLKVVQPSFSSEAAHSTAAILTLNISHFDPPRDGFVIIYIVRAPSRSSSISSSGMHVNDGDDDDDETPNDAGSPAFIDAVTYPGESSTPLVSKFSSSSKITVAMYVVAFDTGSRIRHVCVCYNGNACKRNCYGVLPFSLNVITTTQTHTNGSPHPSDNRRHYTLPPPPPSYPSRRVSHRHIFQGLQNTLFSPHSRVIFTPAAHGFEILHRHLCPGTAIHLMPTSLQTHPRRQKTDLLHVTPAVLSNAPQNSNMIR